MYIVIILYPIFTVLLYNISPCDKCTGDSRIYFNINAVGSVTSSGIRPAPSSLLLLPSLSIASPHSLAQHLHSIGRFAMIRRWVDSTFSRGTKFIQKTPQKLIINSHFHSLPCHFFLSHSLSNHSPMQSLFGLYRTSLFEHSDPPR